jgi:hypothetical protein
MIVTTTKHNKHQHLQTTYFFNNYLFFYVCTSIFSTSYCYNSSKSYTKQEQDSINGIVRSAFSVHKKIVLQGDQIGKSLARWQIVYFGQI